MAQLNKKLLIGAAFVLVSIGVLARDMFYAKKALSEDTLSSAYLDSAKIANNLARQLSDSALIANSKSSLTLASGDTTEFSSSNCRVHALMARVDSLFKQASSYKEKCDATEKIADSTTKKIWLYF